ncbi:hypothetical protein PYCCODRAFT_479422 [Trametes coccinea BRFM310]|uniref:Uncharacterized protein n=1 Tax=Trametes coccinea (strain BRFM310) TaxID=1353009 RepID=A0A1Y2IL10_TRAC3|nr:hypothetical protein PYCCODRAFT_479422 [Trametes coccinea BRFM310]
MISPGATLPPQSPAAPRLPHPSAHRRQRPPCFTFQQRNCESSDSIPIRNQDVCRPRFRSPPSRIPTAAALSCTPPARPPAPRGGLHPAKTPLFSRPHRHGLPFPNQSANHFPSTVPFQATHHSTSCLVTPPRSVPFDALCPAPQGGSSPFSSLQ